MTGFLSPDHLRIWQIVRAGVVVGSVAVMAAWLLVVPGRAQSDGAIEQLQLVYEGAFRVPPGPTDESSFDYGGTALAFDPIRRSLWLVGHDHHQLVAEISIPDIRRGVASIDGLATAGLLTPFFDILGGRRGLIGEGTSKIGGLLRDGQDWIVTAWLFYDGSGEQTLSHFRVSRSGLVSGPFQLGADKRQAGFVSGYMTDVPREWVGPLGGPALTGQCCVNIISRTSLGPAVAVYDPKDVGGRTPVPVAPLLAYPITHPTLGEWSSDGPLFNGNSQVGGLVFPAETGRVIFWGRVGLGPFCYGTGTADQRLHGRPVPGGGTNYCYDPDVSSQGTHGYPYALHVWSYDAAELAAVRAGQKASWDVRPRSAGTLELPFEQGQKLVGGAAYDPATRRIFLSVLNQDGPRPLIHVMKVSTATGSSRRSTAPPVGRAVPR